MSQPSLAVGAETEREKEGKGLVTDDARESAIGNGRQGRVLRILYLFCGEKRWGDLEHWLEEKSGDGELHFVGIDVVRKKAHDLTKAISTSLWRHPRARLSREPGFRGNLARLR